MANKTNIVVLNGKQYSAADGTILGTHLSSVSKPRLVDNFVRTAHTPMSAAHTEHISVKSTPSRTYRVAAKSVKTAPQPAKTLMRHAVKKPSGLSKPLVKTQSPAEASVAIRPAHSFHKVASKTVDTARLGRAQQIAKSESIKRFNHNAGFSLAGAVPAPASQPKLQHVPVIRPVSSTPGRPSQKLFEEALARADAHTQTYDGPVPAKRRSFGHRASYATLFVLVLVFAGFVTYLNVPNLTMGLASARAGFQAHMPGYTPAGYSLRHVTYDSGTVIAAYHSNSDSRDFNITQKSSDWNSEALLANYVSATGKSYQSLEQNGRTVYVYGDSNATWVDGGIWYNVTSNGSVPTRQLLDIANNI